MIFFSIFFFFFLNIKGDDVTLYSLNTTSTFHWQPEPTRAKRLLIAKSVRKIRVRGIYKICHRVLFRRKTFTTQKTYNLLYFLNNTLATARYQFFVTKKNEYKIDKAATIRTDPARSAVVCQLSITARGEWDRSML